MFRDINEIRRENAIAIGLKTFCTSEGKIDRDEYAGALDVSTAFLGRILNPEAAQPRGIGHDLARRIEFVGDMPPNWLDQDHARIPPGADALLNRYQSSPPDVQALIRLVLDDPEMPIPKEIRPSLRTMLQGVQMIIAAELNHQR